MENEVKKSDVALKEEAILSYWKEHNIFQKTLNKDVHESFFAKFGLGKSKNFVFYDGPPFATGLPHYGHILPGTVKDIIPRYKTMKGQRVLRRWGWDTHGLPIENLVEKELGLKSKKDIETYGVEKFNLAARNIVLRYVDKWKEIIPRSGRWIDMENSYITMDSSYTESVWWSFKTLHDKGLVYKDYRAMLYCPRCETTLANFEVNQGYKDITDISVYVKMKLLDEENTFMIAWTTTPWTLPGNAALAVNKEVTYVKAKKDGENYIVAKELAEKTLKENFEVVEEFSGEKLLGKKYVPVFDYYYNDQTLPNRENGWKVYHGDFVTTTDGTGIVHIAPAFGEDDLNLGKANNVPFIQHVAKDGTFKAEVTEFAGQKVKPIEDHQKADVEVIKYLAHKGVLFAKEKIVHSYPHCWRCGTPLLNYATTSWFVSATKLKDRLVAINKNISWTPEDIGEGRFGKWLEGARDWNVSRSRFWGAPLPVWENEKGERIVIGSVDELKSRIKKSGNKFFIMRHGQTENNLKNFWSLDSSNRDPLTQEGERQAVESAKSLIGKGIDVIIASPFERTQETARLVAKTIGLSEDKIITDTRLGEWNVGEEFNGKNIEDFFKARNASENRYTYKTADGESYAEVLRRSGEFLYDTDKEYEGKNVLVISHGAVVRAISLVAQGYAFRKLLEHTAAFYNFDNAEIRELPFARLPHNEMYELDVHRPYIDTVEVLDDNGNRLTRVPEVFDTWYDSGSMPFASVHYPFEHKEEFESSHSSLFPADFIAEGLDQTRGWFYTLLVLSTGLFDKSPYKHVVVNGLVLAEDGRKMSKSLNNYPDLMDVVNKYGADALRYYLVSSPLVKAEDFNFSEKGVDEISKKLIQKLYNVVSFFEMYPTDGEGMPEETVLDAWIISRLSELEEAISTNLDKYELDRASRPILDFVDDLSTWYLRRSRERFKSDDKEVRYTAYYYMKYVLCELSKIIAPFVPFTAEEVYRRAGGALESVHLENWPDAYPRNAELIENMTKAREVVTSALEMRQKANIKVRQPLALLTIPEANQLPEELLSIIREEVNVKDIKIGSDMVLDTNLTEELKKEGVARDIIRAIQDARKTEGLNPGQNMQIVVHASELVQEIMNSFAESIKAPTQVTGIQFVSEPQKHKVSLEGEELSLSIVK